jgi:hypothetical protein
MDSELIGNSALLIAAKLFLIPAVEFLLKDGSAKVSEANGHDAGDTALSRL